MKQIVYLFIPTNDDLVAINFDEAEKLFNDIKVWTGTAYIRSTKNESVKFKTIEYLGDIAGSNKKWDDAVFYYKKVKTNKTIWSKLLLQIWRCFGNESLKLISLRLWNDRRD
jgi:hypothetical protein